MNFTNKMILVPHEIVGENENIVKHLSSLEQEMTKITNDNSIPTDEKLLKYSQILRKYQLVKQETQKPFKFEIQEEEKMPNVQEKTITDPIEDSIKDTVPQKWHKQAFLLLKHSRNIPGLQWNDKGEVIVDGNKVVGSNIVDIINDLARDRKTAEPEIGTDILLKKLLEQNVPKNLIVNRKRLTTLKDEMYASPNKEIETPSPRKTRSSSVFSKWTGLMA